MKPTSAFRIGIDTGGTFTDLVLWARDRFVVYKVRSTPDDPARSILDGLEALGTGARVAEITHGSTVATNAVLERQGARVALVTTAGFEDVLRIGRQTRRELYNFLVEALSPLVASDLTFGIPERMGVDGQPLQAPDSSRLDAIVEAVDRARPEIVAICLLHAYLNPAHEELIAERLLRAGFHVSTSHRVLPEYREFERWSTTVVNAYVTPLMARYLGKLEQQLKSRRLRVMQSNGGSISASTASAAAVQTILSGPAAGVVGAQAVAKRAGYGRAISFDMGGTSTDVSLIDDRIGLTSESAVGGIPIRVPIVDIETVGAGGGSIAYIDAGGALRVGPRSAGANPGPACYGSGSEMTVTDANLLLGRLDADYFLGGRMALDVERARAVTKALASKLGLTDLSLAEGVVRITNVNMERAIRIVSVQRGHDPRDFALVAFGGAGGMHACDLAASLDIPRVILPEAGGVLSALGMLLCDVTRDYSQSILQRSDLVTLDQLERRFRPLVEQAESDLREEHFTGRNAVIERSLDVRYIGQSYEITVPFAPTFRESFARQHKRRYGYAHDRATEVVNVRVKAIGITAKPPLRAQRRGRAFSLEPVVRRKTWFSGRWVGTAFFRRADLRPGGHGSGPAVITGDHATSVIPPGFRFEVDPHLNVIATRRKRRRRGRGPLSR